MDLLGEQDQPKPLGRLWPCGSYGQLFNSQRLNHNCLSETRPGNDQHVWWRPTEHCKLNWQITWLSTRCVVAICVLNCGLWMDIMDRHAHWDLYPMGAPSLVTLQPRPQLARFSQVGQRRVLGGARGHHACREGRPKRAPCGGNLQVQGGHAPKRHQLSPWWFGLLVGSLGGIVSPLPLQQPGVQVPNYQSKPPIQRNVSGS